MYTLTADLAAIARICRAAYECGTEGYAFEAAMIADAFGNLPKASAERLEKTCTRIMEWE